MSVEPNVLFINGMGGSFTSGSIAALRERTIAEFGRKIYCPPPVNYKETGLILRYLENWTDDLIIAGLSCGCSTINAIATHAPKGERIPFAMYYSPSVYCGVGKVPPIIERAQEVNSWAGDWFNLGSQRLIIPVGGNVITKFNDRIKTGMGHGFTCGSLVAQAVLFSEINKALKGTS